MTCCNMYNCCSFPLCGSWCVLLDEEHDWLNSCIVCTCASSPPSVWSCESWDNKLGWIICGIEHMCKSVFLQGSVYAWNAFLQLNLFWIDEAFLEPCSTSNVFFLILRYCLKRLIWPTRQWEKKNYTKWSFLWYTARDLWLGHRRFTIECENRRSLVNI